MDPCPRYDTWWHTQSLCLLFGQGARTGCPWGENLRALWAFFYEIAPLSSVPHFAEKGAAVCFQWFRTHHCWVPAYQIDLLKDLDKAFFKVQVWAWTTRGPSPSRSGDQRWAQKASLATHAPPPPAARARERRGSERGKTWGRCSRQGVLNDTFVRTRLRHLLCSLRGASALLFLSNSPVTTVNSTWSRLGGNFLLQD